MLEARACPAEMSLEARIPVKQTAKTALIADEFNLAFSPHHRVKLYTRSLLQRLKFPLIGMWECQISSFREARRSQWVDATLWSSRLIAVSRTDFDRRYQFKQNKSPV
jgi:hypothetical protein